MSSTVNFATVEQPLRISSLPNLLSCPARAMLISLTGQDSSSGPAADTGSATHLGVAEWHRGKGFKEACAAMRFGPFPQADFEQAEKYLAAYTADPRNAPEEVLAVEVKVQCSLPPHPYDPTGKPVYLSGTLDQIRKGPSVWDYKTGEYQGPEMLSHFLPQLAGYALAGASIYPGLSAGGIIRGRGYHRRRIKGQAPIDPADAPPGIFFEAGMNQETCEVILAYVRFVVAGIRRGEVLLGPGDYCVRQCPFGGVGSCEPLARGLSLKVV